KYPPIAENAPKFAADVVGSAAEISGVALDYSVASLKLVDDIIEGLRRDGCTPEQISATLFACGCYVGEVFVRHADARWRNAAETPMAELSGFPLVIELGAKSLCNPIGKVFKRLKNGEADSLAHFFQAFTTPS